MRNLFSKAYHHDAQHISKETLLEYVDGELATSARDRVAAHLDACWECRTLHAELEDTIRDFMQFRSQALSEEVMPAPPHGWRNFQILLRKQAELSERTRRLSWDFSVAGAFFRSLRPVLARVAVVAAVLVLIVVGFTWHAQRSQVYASTLLRQSITAEESAAAHVVVHRSILLTENDPGSGRVISRQRIELWRSRNKQIARRVYGADGHLIAGEWSKPDGSQVIYRDGKLRPDDPPQNPLDRDSIWQLKPGADDFTRVVSNPQKITVEERPAVYILHYRNGQTGNPKLISASLTLRRSDLHPIEQTLRVEQDGTLEDYRFVEASLERRAADEVAANVFDIDANLLPTQPIPVELVHAERMVEVSTADLEVDALERLDDVDALVRNQLTVNRTDSGKLLVAGVVDTEERKQQIVSALGSLAHNPAVQVSVQTPYEASGQVGAGFTRLQVQEVEISPAAERGNPDIRRYLAQTGQFSESKLDDEVQRFSYRVYNHLADAQLHVMALRHVVESLSASEYNAMSPESQRQWRLLVRKHGEQTQREIRGVMDTLAPVIRPAGSAPQHAAHIDIREATLQMSKLTSAADKVIWQALATPNAGTSAALKDPQLWRSLETVEQLTKEILDEVKP